MTVIKNNFNSEIGFLIYIFVSSYSQKVIENCLFLNTNQGTFSVLNYL